MPAIDINCDMGEGMGNDALVMPYISSANIACGYHAGDDETMRNTIRLASQYRVAVGAHVSFPDKENFGRTEMNLPMQEIHALITKQLSIIRIIAVSLGVLLRHVKPHGALYNMSAKDAILAAMIAKAVKDFDPRLVLFGLSKSHSIDEAKRIGLQTASEVFADRTYQEDGSLTPRSQPNALINDNEIMIMQVLRIIKEGKVTAVNGKEISLVADTICVHGDGPHAPVFAKNIYDRLKKDNIEIKAV